MKYVIMRSREKKNELVGIISCASTYSLILYLKVVNKKKLLVIKIIPSFSYKFNNRNAAGQC